MKKIIFLDIDGVLNSDTWNARHEKEISDGILIDEEKIKLLAILVRQTKAQIILHSGWRTWFSDDLKPLRIEAEKLTAMLADEGLNLAGITPDLTTEEIRRARKFSLVKASEILLWLKGHKDATEWVVLDDLDLHNVQVEKHQVKTNKVIGLTLDDVVQAERILLVK